MASRLLVKHAYLVTVDALDRVFEDGALLAEDGRIVRVGPTDEVLRSAGEVEHELDATRCIVLPGLVDTHVHLAQALLRGVVPDNVSLLSWLKHWVWPLQGAYDASIGKASAELCILEMLRTGTTCFLEAMLHTRYGFAGIAESVAKAGIRGVLSKMVMDLPGYAGESEVIPAEMVEDREASLKEFQEMHRRWDGAADGRINVWLGPRTPGACTESLYRDVARIARERNAGVTMHLAEVKDDLEYFARLKTSPSSFLDGLGLLGEKRVYAHCVWLTDDDIKAFSKTGTSVAHCPSSNLKLASGIAPVPEMLSSGVNVGLGCDGGPSNDCYDLLREMKLAALLHKGASLNPRAIRARDAVRMATINGARALGKASEIGSLEPGKKADFIVVDLSQPHLRPLAAPFSHLVYSATGLDVRTVVIDGRPVVDRYEVQTLRSDDVLENAEKQLTRVLEKTGLEPWRG